MRLAQEESKNSARLPTLRLLCQPFGPLAIGVEKLESLERRLTPSNYYAGRVPSRRQAFLRALSWPLKEAESRRTIEQIALLRSTLSLAIDIDQTSVFYFFIHVLHNDDESNAFVPGIKEVDPRYAGPNRPK